jgi:RNA polymerase sigma factor (sigma-70 family)
VATETLGDVLRRIGRSAGLQGVLSLSDAQLLERFAARRDEPAFAALMVRHGPMVLCVCRRMLHDAGQAEDAFQAAFLVLARKAATIQRRPLLSAWLYGVAYKVAARLRGRVGKRQAREKPTDLDALPAAAERDARDLQPVVQEEVHRLPDKYRHPVILCYLEGKTHEEASLLLRWPLGTVKGRLARARDLLRSRLTRRGVTAGEGAWTSALLACPMAPRAVLVDATIRAASSFAAGDATAGGLASVRALALTQGALRTMILTKVKIAAALALIAALLGGVGTYFSSGWAAEPGDGPKALARAAEKPAAADKGKDDKEAIRGAWQVIGLETGGKDAPDNDETKLIKSGKCVITADKMTSTVGPAEHVTSYKLDPTKKPKEIDVTPQDGPENEKGKVIPAVYSLEGDVLKVCFPSPKNPTRPTEVATKEGGDAMLLILKRQAPVKDKPKEDKEAIRGTWRVIAMEMGGKEAPDNDETKQMKSAKWVFAAEKITVQMKGEAAHTSTYTLNSTTKPKELDVKPEDGPENEKDKLMPTVYSLEGDVLKICIPSFTDPTRPGAVETTAGSKSILLTFKREPAN